MSTVVNESVNERSQVRTWRKKIKSWAKEWLPPVLWRAARRFYGQRGIELREGFLDWEQARLASGGYDQEVILDRIESARREVLLGQARFERDGFTFNQVQYSWPLLAGLMWAADWKDEYIRGDLRVLDFGGSLGSSFFQNQEFLTDLNVQWGVVEQDNFVVRGTALGLDERLTFYDSIESCVDQLNPNVAILSGVLQCLPDPREVLDQLLRSKIRVVILDRTPFGLDAVNDRVCVQVVPPSIYPASYPIWVFARQPFFDELALNYETKAHFEAIDGNWITSSGALVAHEGAILVLRT